MRWWMRIGLLCSSHRERGFDYPVMLSKEEVASLVSAAQRGDKNSLDVLFNDFKPFRHNLASAYVNKGLDIDDVIQQVDYLFIKAVLDYNPELDDNPIRHITASTRQRMYSTYRKELLYKKRHLPKGLFIHTGANDIDTSSVEVEDLITRTLTPEEALVVKLAMMGYLQVDAAEALSVSPPTVSRLFASARCKLKKSLET